MSFHILHLISPNLRVRLKLDRLHVSDLDKGTDRTVPLADVAVIISAARDTEFSNSALRRMAELNVLLIVCNEKFEMCALTRPYYRATNTDLLRRQIEWTPEWNLAMWRQVVTAKIRNQASVLDDLKRARALLHGIADRCEKAAKPFPEASRVSVAEVTASRRAELHSSDPTACESRAAPLPLQIPMLAL